jgi:hypothetical protein
MRDDTVSEGFVDASMRDFSVTWFNSVAVVVTVICMQILVGYSYCYPIFWTSGWRWRYGTRILRYYHYQYLYCYDVPTYQP